MNMKQGSQNNTQNPKKWASPSKKLLARVGWGAGIVAIALLAADNTWSLWGLLCVFISCAVLGYLVAFGEAEERKRKKFEEEIDSFPAAEFMEGMSEFGVEVLLGGRPDGGIENIKLRFPADILKKHLVDAMIYGARVEMEKVGKRMTHHNEEFLRIGYEHRAAMWIDQMTRGQR